MIGKNMWERLMVCETSSASCSNSLADHPRQEGTGGEAVVYCFPPLKLAGLLDIVNAFGGAERSRSPFDLPVVFTMLGTQPTFKGGKQYTVGTRTGASPVPTVPVRHEGPACLRLIGQGQALPVGDAN